MRSRKALKITITLVFLMVLLGLAGCKTPRVYGIKKVDIFTVPAGSTVSMPDGESLTTEKDGRFISNYLIEEVINAKVE